MDLYSGDLYSYHTGIDPICHKEGLIIKFDRVIIPDDLVIYIINLAHFVDSFGHKPSLHYISIEVGHLIYNIYTIGINVVTLTITVTLYFPMPNLFTLLNR